jgi:dihydrolipoamide dehydrogenase
VGLTEDQAKAQGIKVKKACFLGPHPDARLPMVGTHAGDMIGEIALAIEMGADAVDIGKTIHPHPTLGESIGMAAEVAHGSCTDLPPGKK